MKRKAEAVWKGAGLSGNGTLSTTSGALKNLPYSVKLRFENEDGTKGTNPEELVAAAHAGCYAMALSVALEKEGITADTLEVSAVLDLDKKDEGWRVTKSVLKLKATVPGISDENFDKLAKGAKDGCPISNLLDCTIELEYTLN